MMRHRAGVILVGLLVLLAAVDVSGAPQQDKANPDGLPQGALLRIGRPRLRHNGSVISVAFAPDGKIVASVGNDALIRLWDPATGKEIRQLKGHTGGVQSVAFAPDGKHLLTGGYDQKLRLWETSTGKEVRTFTGHNGIILPVAFAPDGKHAASEGQDGTVRLWDVSTGKELHQFPGHRSQGTSNLAFSPDSKILAAVDGEGFRIRLWDVESRKEVRKLEGHTADVNSVDFSADGKLLASASMDETIRVWNVEDGKEIHLLKGHTDLGATVRFAPDGKTLASGSADRTIRLWDVKTGKEIRQFLGHTNIVSEISFSPDGKMLASAGHEGIMRLWDVATGKELPQSGGSAAVLAVSPDGKALATGADDGMIRFWDLGTGKPLPQTLKTQAPLTALAYSPDGQRLAATGLSGNDRKTLISDGAIWDLAKGKAVVEFRLDGVQMTALAFTSDGKTVLGHSFDGVVRLYDATTGKDRERVFAATDGEEAVTVTAMAVSGGSRLLAGTTTGQASGRLWDLATGKELRRLEGEDAFSAVCFSANGHTVVAAGLLGPVRLWETITGKERRSFQPPAPEEEGGGKRPLGRGAVAISPDGRIVASGGIDKIVRLWDVVSGKEIRRYQGHDGPINFLAFAADGKTLLSGSTDTTAIVWDLSGLAKELPPAKTKLTPGELDAAWSDLSSNDGTKAFLAGWTLTLAPEQAVELLRQRLPKENAADGRRRIPELITQLDDDDFEVREKATMELLKIGAAVEGPLREAIAKTPSAEVKRRAELILDKLKAGPATPEALRLPRALEVLERIKTPEARKVLESLKAAK